MRTRIIAVLNQKGGVGKTTTCVNLGAALARRGHRVLLIDMDPQANLTVHLGADFRQVRRSTYSLLLGEHPLAPAVLDTPDPNLRYVPATLALANAEIQLASAVGRELLLREAIEVWLEDDAAGEPSPRVDYVFIDCPPSLGILTMNALCAAGEVLLPIQCEFFALQGVAGILESLKAVQRLNRGLRLSMVVPCMVDRRKTLARDVIEEVEKYFGRLVTRTRIRNNVKLAEAPSHGMTIFQYDASSNGAKDYDALAREVLGELVDEPAAAEEEPPSERAPAPVEAEPAVAEPAVEPVDVPVAERDPEPAQSGVAHEDVAGVPVANVPAAELDQVEPPVPENVPAPVPENVPDAPPTEPAASDASERPTEPVLDEPGACDVPHAETDAADTEPVAAAAASPDRVAPVLADRDR